MDHLGVKIPVHLGPEPGNQHIHHVGLGIKIIAPDVFQNHGLGEHLTGMAEKELQQRELPRLEIQGAALARDLPGQKVHGDVSLTQGCALTGTGGPRHAGTPDERLYPHVKLAERERFGEVIVPAGPNAGNPVVHGLAGAQNEDGRGHPPPPQLADQPEAVLSGKHQINHQNIVLVETGRSQGVFCRFHVVHPIPRLAQPLAEVPGYLCIVFYYQYSHDPQYSTEIMIETGQTAPDFTLSDAQGNPVTLSRFRGTPVVVYFYPKDATPGCTREACSFRDNWEALQAAGIQVLGISADTRESHQAFSEAHSLPFPLLADPEKTVIVPWGAWGTKAMFGKKYQGILRYTFIIDREGVVRKIFKKVKTALHAQEVLEAVQELNL